MSLSTDFKVNIDVPDLTGEPFSFCDGGQYSLTLREALNRVVPWLPTAVGTMPTDFTVRPCGVRTPRALGSNIARQRVMSGLHRMSAYIPYDEQSCARTAILVVL